MEVLQTSALPLGYGATVREAWHSASPSRGETEEILYRSTRRRASTFDAKTCSQRTPKIRAWFKGGLQLRATGGDALRSHASAPGARWLLPARPQPASRSRREVEGANHVFGVPESGWPLSRNLFRAHLSALPTTSLSPLEVFLTMRRHGAKNADYRGGVTCLYDTQLLGA